MTYLKSRLLLRNAASISVNSAILVALTFVGVRATEHTGELEFTSLFLLTPLAIVAMCTTIYLANRPLFVQRNWGKIPRLLFVLGYYLVYSTIALLPSIYLHILLGGTL